ncbi:hypothetical protein DPMN_141515 [Dreissena polymorpha]|uniref:Uncharacterized protein n=1 Tax=Dreissena polymorpha TaxID=45954 RepID=A0A9D4JHR3_DREPO|nr:hypothetical protein DPMN_141515 [Dreissena polymorpha]
MPSIHTCKNSAERRDGEYGSTLWKSALEDSQHSRCGECSVPWASKGQTGREQWDN